MMVRLDQVVWVTNDLKATPPAHPFVLPYYSPVEQTDMLAALKRAIVQHWDQAYRDTSIEDTRPIAGEVVGTLDCGNLLANGIQPYFYSVVGCNVAQCDAAYERKFNPIKYVRHPAKTAGSRPKETLNLWGRVIWLDGKPGETDERSAVNFASILALINRGIIFPSDLVQVFK